MFVAAYQAKIFNELHELDVKHVFIEGFDQQYIEEKSTLKNKHKARKQFGESKSISLEALTRNDLVSLYEETGAFLYAQSHNDVTIHPIPYDRGEFTRVSQLLRSMDPMDQCSAQEYIFTTHEQIAVDAAETFLTTHPGENVAIVFGYLHTLSDNFSPNFHSQMYTGDFFTPSLRTNYDKQQRELLQNCSK
jgi:hypothetical protein